MQPEIFPIAPTLDKMGWVAFGFGAFCLVMTLFFAGVMAFAWSTVRSLQHTEFILKDDGLHVRCFPFSREYAYGVLDLAGAVVTDFQEHPEFKPTLRTAGTSLGSLKGGWHRLRNGNKAMLYVTTRDTLVVIPTTLGHTLLISPQDPVRFLERLRLRAGEPTGGAG